MDANTRGRPTVSLLLTSVAFFISVALDALVVITALPAIHAQPRRQRGHPGVSRYNAYGLHLRRRHRHRVRAG